MYIEKLSLTNIKDILSKMFDGKNVKIKKLNVKSASRDAGFGSIDIDFEVLNNKYKTEGFKTGNITFTDYFAVLNEYDEVKHGYDEKIIKKYHEAMIEEFEKIEARKSKKENLAEKYKVDVDYVKADSFDDENTL